MNLNDYVNDLITNELSDNSTHKLISQIHPDINFKYNSFNICIGKQSTGKTTSVLKELIKMSVLGIKPFHLIIYVSNNSSDDTFAKLKDYVNVPIVKTDYSKLNKLFEQFIKMKELYNSIVDGKYEPTQQEIQML